jgi:hypothetical protein
MSASREIGDRARFPPKPDRAVKILEPSGSHLQLTAES